MQVHIPQPCSASWDSMSPATNGRHCAHCAKTVVDFTSMTDDEVKSYFAQNAGHVCGRFNDRQLSPPPVDGGRRQRFSRIASIGLGWLAALLFGSQKIFAQTTTGTPLRIPSENKVTVLSLGRVAAATVTLNVVDEGGKAVPGYKVKTLHRGNRTIYTISAPDFETRTIEVAVPTDGPKNITVHMKRYVVIGDTVLTGLVQR